jgi:predicted acyltransferase
VTTTTIPAVRGPGAAPARTVTPAPSTRLVSLDALRGWDMFWIIGADRVIRSLGENSASPVLLFLREQFEHVEWEGFHFYDFIFPLFLFLIGVSIPYSFARRLAGGERKGSLYRHILLRAAIMVFFGMMITGNLLQYRWDTLDISYSVLQVLAIGYVVASLMYLNLALRTQIAATAGMLVLFWALMTFAPAPGHVIGVYRPGATFGDWLNDALLGNWQINYPNSWILNTLTYGATAMLGVFAGRLLRSAKPAARKLLILVALGAVCLAAGYLWSYQFPIIKRRWTSSYVLAAGGWSYLLLALFYWVVDMKGYRRWTFPFVVIGMNSIAAYMGWGLFSGAFRRAAEVFTNGLKPYVGGWHDPITWTLAMLMFWLVLYFMYRQRIFLRI